MGTEGSKTMGEARANKTTEPPESALDMSDETGASAPAKRGRRKDLPTEAQGRWLRRGLEQPGGKLPLFDEYGRRVDGRIVRACLEKGWAEPWFVNPLKPDWQVCKLTDAGRQAVGE